MGYLIILDYCTDSVNIFHIEFGGEYEDLADVVQNLGFKLTEVSYMFTDELKLSFNEG